MRKAPAHDFVQAVLLTVSDDCIAWPFAKSGNGYGVYRGTSSHRFVLQAATGFMGVGMEACHNCGNKICVNPRHLRWDTPAGNMAERYGLGGSNFDESKLPAMSHIMRRKAAGRAP